MAGLQLGGLASGLDTTTIISQLMAIDRAPETRMQLQQSVLQARQTALTDIGTRVRNLLDKAKDLGDVATWADTQKLDVSDTTKLTATRLSGAAPGGHDINVTTLARSEQRSYAFQSGAATLTIGAATVNLTDSDDGQSAADKINATATSPVYAVWVQDPLGDTTKDRLVLTRKDTGEYQQGDMAVAGAGWTTTETYKAGVNAAFTVDDGQVQYSKSNVVKSAIPGLQLTFKATGATSVSVTPPGPDQDAVQKKLQSFVDQYNSTVDFVRGKLTEKKVPNATTTTDAAKGVLFGDPQLTGLLSQLRNMMTDKTGIAGSVQSMADLGISTGSGSGGAASADALAGKLTFDTEKFADAFESGRLDIKAFMSDPAKGIGAKVTALLDPVAKPTSGLLDVRAKQAGDQSSDIDDQIAALEARLDERQTRLQAQFTAMEQALSQSQSQGSWLTAQLG
jgi:flagellar hook-associated protein 2